MLVLQSSAASAGRNTFCLPISPDEYVCTEGAISEEEKTEVENLTVGGVKQHVEGSEAEQLKTLKNVMSMALYLRDLRKTHPDIAQKWFVWK